MDTEIEKDGNTEVVFLRLDYETKMQLEKLAKMEERNQSSELRWLIRREYYRLVMNEQVVE